MGEMSAPQNRYDDHAAYRGEDASAHPVTCRCDKCLGGLRPPRTVGREGEVVGLTEAASGRNVLSETAVGDIAAKSQVKGIGEVLHVAFTQPRPRSARAIRPHFNQSEIARKRRLKLQREAARFEREAEIARSAGQVLGRLQQYARAHGRPLGELLKSRRAARGELDKVIAQLVVQFGRKPVLIATNYKPEQLTRSYKRGFE